MGLRVLEYADQILSSGRFGRFPQVQRDRIVHSGNTALRQSCYLLIEPRRREGVGQARAAVRAFPERRKYDGAF
jgi:hypothetical protein